MSLRAAYTHGTHRLIPPEQTLAHIAVHLSDLGITRCADVTGLDHDLGVPTYCAIRPNALTLQISNGKGLTHTSAQVSGLMESIELFHAEHPEPGCLRRSSLEAMSQHGLNVIRPEKLSGFHTGFFSNDYVIDWVEGENLVSGDKVSVPASVVYFGCEPMVNNTSSNGLASGNHLVEATLHALYELIERDAISSISMNGRLKIKEKCRIVDIATIPDDQLQETIRKIQAAQIKLVLLWTKSCVPVHTFWAILLDQSPFASVPMISRGFGTHIDIYVAAARAITEAVQSRLTVIHGSREDLTYPPSFDEPSVILRRVFTYFDNLAPNSTWSEIKGALKKHDTHLLENYEYLVSRLAAAGHNRIIRFDLTKPLFAIPVVKVIVPSLRFRSELF